MVDEQSASASEVLAGILQDYGKAIVIGTKTYGKGTVQRVVSLYNGGGIRFTIAEYVLPSGSEINKVGLLPDVPVPSGELPGWAEEQRSDEMLQAALARIDKGLGSNP